MIVKVEIIAEAYEIQHAHNYLNYLGFKPNYNESGPIPKGEKYHPHYKVAGTKNILTGHDSQVLDSSL